MKIYNIPTIFSKWIMQCITTPTYSCLNLLNQSNNIWVSTHLAKYGLMDLWRRDRSLQTKQSGNCKGLYRDADLLKEGFQKTIGTETSISIMLHPWCSDIPLKFKPSFTINMSESFTVSNLMQDRTWSKQSILRIGNHAIRSDTKGSPIYCLLWW